LSQSDRSPSAGSDEIVDEIISIGIKQSLELMVNAKRYSDSIMDGVSSEGIGRFPDMDLAEAIGGITGVQLEYAGAGGERREGEIRVRGLPKNYAKTLYNGQTLASGNPISGFVYGMFQSDVVSGVQLVKTPTAAFDEGGLSGIVNIKTRRPLAFGSPFVTFYSGMDFESLPGVAEPNANLAFANKFNNETVGIMGAISWSDRRQRTDLAKITNYDDDDTDGDGLADLYTPIDARVYSRQNEGDKITAAFGLEFQPNDKLNMGFTGIYSLLEDFNIMDQLRFRRAQSMTVEETIDAGAFGATATQVLFNQPEIDAESRAFDDERTSYAITGDITWQTDEWRAKGILHSTRGTQDRWGVSSRRNINDHDDNGVILRMDNGAGDVDAFRVEMVEGDFSDINQWSYGESVRSNSPPTTARTNFYGSGDGRDREESEVAAQFDLTKLVDGPFIKTAQVGAKWRSYERHQRYPRWTNRDFIYDQIDDLGVMRPHIGNNNDGFFEGNLPGVTNYWVPDWRLVIDDILGATTITGDTFGGLPVNTDTINRTFDAKRDVTAFYAMVKFDGNDLELPLPVRGNFGLRYVSTDREVSSVTQSDLLAEDIFSTASQEFSHTLPSLNLIFDVKDDVLLRLGYSENITRPNAFNYRTNSTARVRYADEADSIVESVEIDLNSAAIMPFTADSYDLSLEWYNRSGSYISLAYFRKDVADKTGQSEHCPNDLNEFTQLDVYDFSGIITGNLSRVGDECLDSAGIPVLIEDEFNSSEGASFDGFEASLIQNFDFMDNWMRHVGIQANMTYVDTSASGVKDSAGNDLPLEGVSKNTLNLKAFYEKDNWAFSVQYRNRSEYFVNATGSSFSGDDRMIAANPKLDVRLQWKPMKNLSTKLEIYNITNERRTEYQGVEERVREIRYYGRIYKAGIRYKF
tara:strand:- start:12434 stop:15190 length:2757 start_codon:yes stop_codon:yes gene_type:complete